LDAGVNTAISGNDGNYGRSCVQKITRPDGQHKHNGRVVWNSDGVSAAVVAAATAVMIVMIAMIVI
jgi:hypothetical protein